MLTEFSSKILEQTMHMYKLEYGKQHKGILRGVQCHAFSSVSFVLSSVDQWIGETKCSEGSFLTKAKPFFTCVTIDTSRICNWHNQFEGEI